jgi:hypothetical protein
MTIKVRRGEASEFGTGKWQPYRRARRLDYPGHPGRAIPVQRFDFQGDLLLILERHGGVEL